MPDLYIITGSNGAGKSTIGPEYLPLEIKEKCFVFDGDKLFMQHKKHLWEKGLRAHFLIANQEERKNTLPYFSVLRKNLI